MVVAQRVLLRYREETAINYAIYSSCVTAEVTASTAIASFGSCFRSVAEHTTHIRSDWKRYMYTFRADRDSTYLCSVRSSNVVFARRTQHEAWSVSTGVQGFYRRSKQYEKGPLKNQTAGVLLLSTVNAHPMPSIPMCASIQPQRRVAQRRQSPRPFMLQSIRIHQSGYWERCDRSLISPFSPRHPQTRATTNTIRVASNGIYPLNPTSPTLTSGRK